jgi:predicted enzyme related to lactoylglutathione lyase
VPEVSNHAPGTFSWPELATTDQKAGAAFYRTLFGWDINEQPIGPAETYTMFQLRGKPVAAAYTMRPEEKQTGAPPHWNNYVTVASADESVQKAQSRGAQ